jgi:TolB-like protein/Flp pilus assembly protein TadD
VTRTKIAANAVSASTQTSAKLVAPFTPAAQSIAVLAFVDMSEKKDQAYFSDGLAEELIELLGRTPGLRVIARTSSFYFKGRVEKLETIAAELRVANVLEGSVRTSGNKLRVTAQLIRADTSEHLWSETFDRELPDVFKVQDEIAGAVVTALKVRLLPAVQSDLRTENIEAYNQYLRGRESYNRGDTDGYQRAVAAFSAATVLDPHYAAAYADLSLAEFWLGDTTGNQAGYRAGCDRAIAAAEKAVVLAPALAAGYSARGTVRTACHFDFATAQADLKKAIGLSPSDPIVLHRSAIMLAILGDLPGAIVAEERALGLDPLSAEIAMRLAFFLTANQQLAQARPWYEKALAIAPHSARVRFNLAELDLLENRPEQALAGYRQTGDENFSRPGEAKAEYSLGHFEISRRILEQLVARDDDAYQVARVYAWRGQKDQAFAWAERAYANRDSALVWIKIDPFLRNLRGDPRYQSLLHKMNLSD